MGQYKLIKFFCEIRTDGDFSFKLIPPCMRMDFDKEHYKIEKAHHIMKQMKSF